MEFAIQTNNVQKKSKSHHNHHHHYIQFHFHPKAYQNQAISLKKALKTDSSFLFSLSTIS